MINIQGDLLWRNYVCDGCHEEISKGELVLYIQNKEITEILDICICKNCAETMQIGINYEIDKFNLGLKK